MKFNFPKILHEFALSEYDPQLQEKVTVWVNPTGKLMEELFAAFSVYLASPDRSDIDGFVAILSELLSQGEPPTRWSVDELRDLKTATSETDPRFWMWFNNRILKEIQDHRIGVKKN